MSATDMEQEPDSRAATEQQPCLSKTQLKKLRKREKWLAQRPERRKLEKEKQKAKRRAAAEERSKLGLARSEPPKTKLMSESNNRYRVVIDLDFDECMTDAEVAASAQQVGRIYSLNRHAENPCQLYLSSLKGRMKEKFASANTGYENWDCNISESDYLNMFTDDQKSSEEKSHLRQFIYLTGDAEEDLPDIEEILRDESKIFIIGGLVDHNRHKMLSYKRASDKKIPTARLPITKYVKLAQRSILSTVAVFEIMLMVLGYRKSWSEALLHSIPKRMIAHPIVDKTVIVENKC